MLRYVYADTVFDSPGIWWETERVWLDSFGFGTSTTEDRKRIHEQQTGMELDWFFDEWIYQAGYPKYSLTWDRWPDGDSFIVVTTLVFTRAKTSATDSSVAGEARPTMTSPA